MMARPASRSASWVASVAYDLAVAGAFYWFCFAPNDPARLGAHMALSALSLLIFRSRLAERPLGHVKPWNIGIIVLHEIGLVGLMLLGSMVWPLSMGIALATWLATRALLIPLPPKPEWVPNELRPLSPLTFAAKARLSSIALVQDRLIRFDEDRRDWRSFDLKTRQETVTKLVLQSIGSAVVSPNGNELYAMAASSSHDVGRVQLLDHGRLEWRPSPLKGAYACGGLWTSADGTRVFSGCGTIQRLSPSPPGAALSLEGKLPDITRLQYLTHAPALGELAVIPGPPRKKRITFPVSRTAQPARLAWR